MFGNSYLLVQHRQFQKFLKKLLTPERKWNFLNSYPLCADVTEGCCTDIITRMTVTIKRHCQSMITVYTQTLLGAFAKFRKATVCFVISVRPSIHPHAKTRLSP